MYELIQSIDIELTGMRSAFAMGLAEYCPTGPPDSCIRVRLLYQY